MRHPEKLARNRTIQKVIQLTILIALLVFSPASPAYAAACTATTSGNWSSAGTWSCGHVPTSSDDVMIGNGLTVTVDIPASVNSLTLNNGNASTTLTISGTNSLIVTGDVTLINTTSGTNKILAVGTGTLTVGGNLNLNEGGGTQVTRLTISTGTVSVNGNITVNAGGTLTNAQVVFSGAGTLNVAGAYPAGTTLTTAGAGTVNFTGGAQTIPAYTYYNLGLSGSGTKTLPAANLTVGGNLIVGDGTTLTNTTNNTLTVTGTSTVNGNVNLTGTGTKTFTGSVMINSGGVWTESSTGAFFFSGDFTNNGSFTANAATHTFNGTGGKTIGGMNAISFTTATFTQNYTNSGMLTAGTLNVTGAAIRLTNNGTITVNTSLASSGGVIQGANAVLNLRGTTGITTLTATAAGNTVNYVGAAAQTVKSTTYANLVLSGNGVKTLPAGTIVNSNLNIIHAGGATASIAAGQTLAVNSLALDGLGQTTPPFPTTWGGTGSGAVHINSTYFAATTGRLNVAGVDSRTLPTITFGPAPTPTYLGGPFTVSATTTNTDSTTLIYSAVSGPCVLVGGATFNSTGAGTCVVQAYGAPTANFSAVTATQSITIAKASQAPLIVSANPSVVVQGFTSTLSSGGGSGTGAVTYSVGASTGCTVAGNIVTVTDASGTCSVTSTKATDTNYLAATSAPVTITLVTYQSEINKDFSPINILPGAISHLSIKVYNPNAFDLQNTTWTDNLIGVQPGIRLADLVNLSNDCGGTVTALPGSTTVSLSGGSIPAKVGSTNGVCTVTVDVTSTTAGNLINTIPAGTLSATDGSGNLVTNTTPASATLQVTTIIAPTINKNFNPATIWAGANSLLTINLLNQDATNPLSGVGVTDTLPENVVISSTVFSPALTNCGGGTLTAVPGTRTISLSGATIPAGVGQTCAIRVNTTSSTQGSYINTIPARAIQTDQGITNAQQAQATLNVQQLNLTKAFAPATIPAGGTSTVTITLQNPTAVNYTNVGLVDALPAGMSYVSAGVGTCGGSLSYDAGLNQVTLSGGLAPGSMTPPTVRTCTIIFTVTTPYTAGTSTLTNTIPAGTLTNDQNISNPTSVSANLAVNSAISAVKSFSPANISVNNPSTATITLRNYTSTPITSVTMTDTLTGGLVLYADPAALQCGGTVTGTAGGTTVQLSGGTVPAGNPGTCTIQFQVTSVTAGTYVNSIPIGNICGTEGVLGTVCNTAQTNSGNLVVSASALPVVGGKGFCATGPCAAGATNSIAVNGSSAMSIRLTAPADTNLTNFNMTDTLPAGMTIYNTTATKNASCIGGTLNVTTGAGSFSWTGGQINAGTTCIITVNVTASTSGTLTNTIYPGDITNNQGRTVAAAFGASMVCSDYMISKSFTPTIVNANGLSRARITFTNHYDVGLTNLTMTDSLPANLFVAPVPNISNNGCGGTVTANAGASVISLANGSVLPKVGGVDGICYIDVDVRAAGAAGTRTNTIPIINVTANVSGITVNPRTPASGVLTVAPLSITVNKSFFPLTVFGGSASTMTVTLANPNNAPLTRITFIDNMPAGMYLASPANLNPGTCGGSMVGNPGDTSFTYIGEDPSTHAYLNLPANSSCSMTLSVSTNVSGNLTNSIGAGAVTSFNGAQNAQSAEATLTNLGGVSITKLFLDNPIYLGDTSILRLRVTNSSNFILHNLGLSDTLPAGLEIAASPAPTNACGGSLTAVAGAQTISLATGSIDPTASCDITVPVTGSVDGAYLNNIPIGNITNTENQTNTDVAEDTLTILPLASIGDFVWDDLNANGIQDSGEPGIPNVTVELFNGADVSQGTTVTSASGIYGFAGLVPGDYYLVFTLPAGYAFSPQDQGSDDTLDSDANLTTGRTATTTLTSGENDLTWDAGMVQPASLGDLVWNDLNANGIQDSGEPGLANVTVNLYTGAGVFLSSTTTNSGGNYLFSNLSPGSYYIEFLPPSGYVFSPQDQGSDDAIDSDANITTGLTATTTLGPGENDLTWDAGLFTPSISVSKAVSAIVFTSPDLARMTYTITINNPNSTPLSDIQATDDLQAAFSTSVSFTLIDLTATNLTENPSYDGISDMDLLTGNDTLAPGASGTITLIVDVETGGSATTYTNTVDGSGQPPTGPRVTGTASAIGPSFADPAVAKTADITQAMVGEVVTFTITVTNNGNQTAANVRVTDPLPSNLNVITATSSPVGTVSIIAPRTVVVDIGDVDPGDVITIQISARVNSLGTPPIQNLVTLTTTSPTDILSNNESAVTLDIISPVLPSTGFAPGHQTSLPTQPVSKAYLAYDGLTLNIPGLRITLPIVGVPKTETGWDVTWLDKNAGWLNGTAFPTWNGNSVITGHVYLSNGFPGPFMDIDKLKYGDQIIINAFGKKYIYEVRSVSTFKPDNTSKVLQHEDNSWITLLTCKDYDVRTNTYHNRVAVKAVLVKVADK